MAVAKIKHVYVGPKDPVTGEMMDEPVYSHQEYPRTLYHPDYAGWPREGKVFEDEDAVAAALKEGWLKTPADAGIILEPSREQLEEMKMAEFKAKMAPAKKGKE